MCRFSLPPGYSRSGLVARPYLDAMVLVIDAVLEEDGAGPVKQRHTTQPSRTIGTSSRDLSIHWIVRLVVLDLGCPGEELSNL